MLPRILAAGLLFLSLAAPSHRTIHTQAPDSMPYLVLIIMDGFRPDYATLAPMRHLRALMARGMSYDTAWVGQLESETPTSHATIGTGVYPKKHGVVGFGFRDPSTGGYVYMPTDLNQIGAGKLTRLIEGGGVPTLSDLVHRQNQRNITVAISGEKYYAAATVGAGADYVLYGADVHNVFRPFAVQPNVPPARTKFRSITGDSNLNEQDSFASRLAVQMVKTLRPRALLLNLPDPDIAGHYYGGMSDPKDMAMIARETDYAIGRVASEYRRLGLLHRTLFVVTADHGMAANRHTVPIHRVYDLVRSTQIPTLDEELRASMGAIWLHNGPQAPTLAASLATARIPGVEGALYKDVQGAFAATPSTAAALSKPLLQAYLDLANTEAGPTGSDVLLPYGEDTIGWANHQRIGKHGGFSWGVQHIPLVLAGPGIRHGTSHYPAQLVDIAPTIERLLGLQVPKGVDGVVLQDSMTVKVSPEQRLVESRRLADIHALEAHSAAQSGG